MEGGAFLFVLVHRVGNGNGQWRNSEQEKMGE